jgi:hypothetical protein
MSARPTYLEVLDEGQARTLPELPEEGLEVGPLPLGNDLDPAVKKIPDPARDSQCGCPFLGEVAIGDTLDPSRDDDMDPGGLSHCRDSSTGKPASQSRRLRDVRKKREGFRPPLSNAANEKLTSRS